MSTAPPPAHQYLHVTRELWVRLGRTPDEPALTVTGPDDSSAQQLEPDQRCTLCRLHSEHSEAAHQKRVGR